MRLSLGLLLLVAVPAAAQISIPALCGVGLPPAEREGYTPLPGGDVFCPLMADPKALRSFVSFQRSSSKSLKTNIGAVGISDFIGLARWNGSDPGNGVQISVNASVFAQFDVKSSSYDLLNADYLIGLPITFRRNAFSGRVRVYHQSSHLGDEFLARSDDPRPDRDNVSFEAAEMLLSVDAGILRLYAGGDYLLHFQPKSLERYVVHTGAELRQHSPFVSIGSIANLRLVAAVDLKASKEHDWSPATSARAGIEIARPRDNDVPARRWSILGEWYNGPSPYGQFYREGIRYYGIGAHFTP